MLSLDRDTVLDPNSAPSFVFSAIVRLGSYARPEDQALIQELAGRRDGVYRAGAADALGFYDDSICLETLRKLLTDSDPMVRMRAIRGLGHRKSAERETLLGSLLGQSALAPEQKVVALSSLVKAAPAETVRNRAVGELVKLASASGNASVASGALRELIDAAPNDPSSMELFNQALLSNKNELLQPQMIRSLSAARSPWLRKNYRKFMEHPSAMNRLAAVQSLPAACPQERWAMLESLLRTEKDQTVLQFALRAPAEMPSPEAARLIEGVLAQPKSFGGGGLREDEIRIASESRARLKSAGSDPCARFQDTK
jgi:HEAT repeat protein